MVFVIQMVMFIDALEFELNNINSIDVKNYVSTSMTIIHADKHLDMIVMVFVTDADADGFNGYDTCPDDATDA